MEKNVEKGWVSIGIKKKMVKTDSWLPMKKVNTIIEKSVMPGRLAICGGAMRNSGLLWARTKVDSATTATARLCSRPTPDSAPPRWGAWQRRQPAAVSTARNERITGVDAIVEAVTTSERTAKRRTHDIDSASNVAWREQ